ncbi:MAG: hypothetical protein LQ338_005641 [Usnochroma carphineum]|nr:MAG: hypothetical protein LQ338_005641 [Usnochroma carphineum]
MPLIEDSQASVDMTMTAQPSVSPDSTPSSKKRKRTTEAAEQLEVDVNAPEPPSKKALRKAKKGKIPTATRTAAAAIASPDLSRDEDDEAPSNSQTEIHPAARENESKRSSHGIWIGNLPYTATKADLRTFFTNGTKIAESMITRIHMPAPTDSFTSLQKIKAQNKGFAYIDFSTPETVAEAIQLSDTLLAGRKVLIKDAHNFEGRPEKTANGAQDASVEKAAGKPPSKRVFVGNLTFDTEKADLEEHFLQCGEVVDVHVATFEDSGKCKGYAWVTFAEAEAAEAAMRGWIVKEPEDDSTEDDGVEQEEEDGDGRSGDHKKKKPPNKSKKPKPRKWWINKLKGRQLRMEFAEDATVRYKKRFGKDARKSLDETNSHTDHSTEMPTADATASEQDVRQKPKVLHRPPKKFDARTVKPGAALAAAPRLTGGIVASQGKKITFN